MITWRSAALVALMATTLTLDVAANPTPTESPSARTVGRAGIGTVSEDSGFALLVNPAGLARRGQRRAIAALRLIDANTTIDSSRVDGEPTVSEKSGPEVLFSMAYAQGLSERLVLAAAIVEGTAHERDFGRPQFGQQAPDVERFFPARYAGLGSEGLSLTVAAGAAYRVNDWLALGAGLSWSRRELGTRRAIWAGFSGRDTVGSAEKDLTLTVEGTSNAVLGAHLGLLAAPVDVPIELGAAVHAVRGHTLDGRAALARTTNAGDPPTPGADVDATLERPTELTARAGIRLLTDRATVEAGATATIYVGNGDESWGTDPLRVVDESGAEATVTTLPALIRPREQFAIGAATDIAVVEGFLWLTGGYAYRPAAGSLATRGPLHLAPAGHRLAIGAEAVWSTFTITLGFAHELSPDVAVGQRGSMPLLNPFDAGTAPAAAGRYQRHTSFGSLSIELGF